MNWDEAKRAVDRYVDTRQPTRDGWMVAIQRVPYGRGAVLVYWIRCLTDQGKEVKSPQVYLSADSDEAALWQAAQQALSLIP